MDYGPFSGPLMISMATVQKLAGAYGLTLNAVELTNEEFLSLRYPAIVALDLTQDGQADHYVVVIGADEGRVTYLESDGTRERLPTYEFLRLFTRYALVASGDSYGRLLSQTQARQVRGGAIDISQDRWKMNKMPGVFAEPAAQQLAMKIINPLNAIASVIPDYMVTYHHMKPADGATATMIGAIVAHFTVLHTPPTLPVVLLCLAAVVGWLRRA